MHEQNIILDLFILSLLNLRDMAKRNVLSFYLINSTSGLCSIARA